MLLEAWFNYSAMIKFVIRELRHTPIVWNEQTLCKCFCQLLTKLVVLVLCIGVTSDSFWCYRASAMEACTIRQKPVDIDRASFG